METSRASNCEKLAREPESRQTTCSMLGAGTQREALQVPLPAEFCFEGSEVHIRRDPVTGEVVLSKPTSVAHGGVERCRSNLLSRLQSIAFGLPR
jgi:hypothetical protein